MTNDPRFVPEKRGKRRREKEEAAPIVFGMSLAMDHSPFSPPKDVRFLTAFQRRSGEKG